MEQTVIFTITAGGLMIVEVLLILKVVKLTQTLQKMNENIDSTQKMIMEKIRAVVDLVLKVQGVDFKAFKSGSAEISAGKTHINVKVEQENGKRKRK